MKALLDNKYAPITFTWGFVETPFAEFSQAFREWQEHLDKRFGTMIAYRSFTAPLSESLLALDPLTSPQDRYLLVETRSGWSAIFSNGLNVNDVHSPVSYLPTVLNCRGLEISCAPDRSRMHGKGGLQIYGAVKFALYGPETKDWLNTIRYISIANDVSGWEFSTGGEVQPFEQVENYEKRKIVDRFTPEMLESYCAALGIDLFNADSYGGQSLLVHTTNKATNALTMPIGEARSRVHIPIS